MLQVENYWNNHSLSRYSVQFWLWYNPWTVGRFSQPRSHLQIDMCLKESRADGLQVKTHEKDDKNWLLTSWSRITKGQDLKGRWVDYPFLRGRRENTDADKHVCFFEIRSCKSQNIDFVRELERSVQILHVAGKISRSKYWPVQSWKSH